MKKKKKSLYTTRTHLKNLTYVFRIVLKNDRHECLGTELNSAGLEQWPIDRQFTIDLLLIICAYNSLHLFCMMNIPYKLLFSVSVHNYIATFLNVWNMKPINIWLQHSVWQCVHMMFSVSHGNLGINDKLRMFIWYNNKI